MTTTNWRAFLQPYLDTWKSQGRNAEQIYGVENFLSGQGQLGIEQLLSSAHQQWVSEVVGKLQELKEGCRLGITKENDKNPDCQYCAALDAAISVIKDKSND